MLCQAWWFFGVCHARRLCWDNRSLVAGLTLPSARRCAPPTRADDEVQMRSVGRTEACKGSLHSEASCHSNRGQLTPKESCSRPIFTTSLELDGNLGLALRCRDEITSSSRIRGVLRTHDGIRSRQYILTRHGGVKREAPGSR